MSKPTIRDVYHEAGLLVGCDMASGCCSAVERAAERLGFPEWRIKAHWRKIAEARHQRSQWVKDQFRTSWWLEKIGGDHADARRRRVHIMRLLAYGERRAAMLVIQVGG